MCFELSSHLKEFWNKSVAYIYILFIYLFIYLFIIYYFHMLAFCSGDTTLRESHAELAWVLNQLALVLMYMGISTVPS